MAPTSAPSLRSPRHGVAQGAGFTRESLVGVSGFRSRNWRGIYFSFFLDSPFFFFFFSSLLASWLLGFLAFGFLANPHPWQFGRFSKVVDPLEFQGKRKSILSKTAFREIPV